MALFGLIGAFVPLATAYIGKLIIDGVVGTKPPYGWTVIELVWIEMGLMLLLALTTRGAGLLRSILGTKLGYALHLKILRKALTLELRHFEDPELYDHMQNARRETSSRPLNLFT